MADSEKKSAEKNKYEKLLDLQSRLLKIGYDGENQYYKYPTLQKIKEKLQPILVEFNWVLTQPIEYDKETNKVMLHTRIYDATEKEIAFEDEFPLFSKDEKNPQEWGKSITYFRRYTLLSLLGLVGDKDDDCFTTDEEYKKQILEMESVEELTNLWKKLDSDRRDALLETFKKKKAEFVEDEKKALEKAAESATVEM